MAAPHLHVVTPARSERGRRRSRWSCTAFTQHGSIHKGGRQHAYGAMALIGHIIKGKHAPLMGLWQDDGTMCRGGLVETIQLQPPSTLGDGRKTLLGVGFALTNFSGLREGRVLGGGGGERVLVEVALECSEGGTGGGVC